MSEHELNKLDRLLDVPIGTSKSVIVGHADSTVINTKLAKYGIKLKKSGILPKEQRMQWRALMIAAGVSEKYWKDPDLLTPRDGVIADL